MQVFVPIEDIGDVPDDAGPLLPYQYGMRIWSVEVIQREAEQSPAQSRCSSSRSPGFTPSDSATPALSSSTY